MRRRELGRWLEGIAVTALTGHVVLTALHNLPDQHLELDRLHPRLGRLPTWRFFGPNPGVEDMHVMVRRLRSGTPVSAWAEVDLAVPRPWYAPVWNPRTRGPKTLFDAVQQVKLLVSLSNGDFATVTRSPAYTLLADVARTAVAPDAGHDGHDGHDAAQFMLLTTRPGPRHSDLQPVMVSELLPVGTTAPTGQHQPAHVEEEGEAA